MKGCGSVLGGSGVGIARGWSGGASLGGVGRWEVFGASPGGGGDPWGDPWDATTVTRSVFGEQPIVSFFVFFVS